MNAQQFERLQPGDRFKVKGCFKTFTVSTVETWHGKTHSLNTTDGRRLKVNDREVQQENGKL